MAVMLSCRYVFAIPIPQVLKLDPVASSGRCVIAVVKANRDADQILRQYNIATEGARPEERMALAAGVAHASALAAGRAEFLRHMLFTFETRKGYSRYIGVHGGLHQLQMNRCLATGLKCKSNNVAHLMHEMGHRVGHYVERGIKLYDRYDQLQVKCHLSSYSRKNKREEFAEVFAAFITRPELLSQGSSDCRKSFRFLAQDLFKVDPKIVTCDSSSLRQVVARFERIKGVMVAALPRKNKTSSPTPSQPIVRPAPVQIWRPQPAPQLSSVEGSGEADEPDQDLEREVQFSSAWFRGRAW